MLVFSGNANTSPQIEREVERAISKGLPIIPFRIEDIKPSEELEYFISASHWLDAFTKPLEQHLDRLAEVVRRVIEVKYRKDGASSEAEEDTHRRESTAKAFAAEGGQSIPQQRQREVLVAPKADERQAYPGASAVDRASFESGWKLSNKMRLLLAVLTEFVFLVVAGVTAIGALYIAVAIKSRGAIAMPVTTFDKDPFMFWIRDKNNGVRIVTDYLSIFYIALCCAFIDITINYIVGIHKTVVSAVISGGAFLFIIGIVLLFTPSSGTLILR
ncbi:MAG: hypothetical protein ACLP4V_29245 [Methylocella sp.]